MTGLSARKLLVATPRIGDGNFERTVVLLVEHNAEGAFGLVLNRPTSLVVGEMLTGWEGTPGVLHSGGPVSPETLIALSVEWPGCADTGWQRIIGNIGSADLSLGPEHLAETSEVRIFFGYAGWSAKQLEQEIAAGAWFVVDARPDDVLCKDPEGLWQAVLARQATEVSWFRNYPDNPRAN